MTETKRKIKELYNCEYIISDELYPLQRWHNKLIDKTIDEITLADVLRMIRQKEFIELAMTKALYFLKNDPFVGETYDGELLEHISKMDTSLLTAHSGELKFALEDASTKIETHEWFFEEEKEEYEEIVNSVLKKL